MSNVLGVGGGGEDRGRAGTGLTIITVEQNIGEIGQLVINLISHTTTFDMGPLLTFVTLNSLVVIIDTFITDDTNTYPGLI